MARSSSSSSSLFFLGLSLGLLLFLAQFAAAAAARSAPAAKKDHEEAAAAAAGTKRADKKEKDCFFGGVQEGTTLIPGVGRYQLGSHRRPTLRGLDHSGPAAAHARFLPGGDDTFVPNPGYEIPNPFRRIIP